ncbi:MAG: hypothetical protein VX923_04250 [Pseudomonadota bacterium]|nr:hypothetical protein [Pseudomonadota bacterium]
MENLVESLDPPYYMATLNERQYGIKDKEEIAPTDRMVSLAMRQKGFLGLNSSRDKKGKKSTISYWRDIDDIEMWINVGEHKITHQFGIGLAETCSIKVSLIENDATDSNFNQILQKFNKCVFSKIKKISEHLS